MTAGDAYVTAQQAAAQAVGRCGGTPALYQRAAAKRGVKVEAG